MSTVKKPKICIIHYSSPPVIGGVEFVIQAQARLFAGAGYSVKLLTGKGGQIETRENTEVRAVPEITRALRHQVNVQRTRVIARDEVPKQSRDCFAYARNDVLTEYLRRMCLSPGLCSPGLKTIGTNVFTEYLRSI